DTGIGIGDGYDIPAGLLRRECKFNLNETSFQFPVDSPGLFLVARGARSSGKLNVVQSPEFSDLVRVDIVSKTDHPLARLRTMMCGLENKNGERGVGIFASISSCMC